jgi:hypothetical protein
MGTMLSGLSLLMALALAGFLIKLARENGRHIAESSSRRGHGNGARDLRRTGRYTPLGYAFTFTLAAAWFIVSGLIGFRLDRHGAFLAGTRWSSDVIWWQVLMGLAMACLAVYYWRKGLHDIRSNIYVPELAGHDIAVPPPRRIGRR